MPPLATSPLTFGWPGRRLEASQQAEGRIWKLGFVGFNTPEPRSLSAQVLRGDPYLPVQLGAGTELVFGPALGPTLRELLDANAGQPAGLRAAVELFLALAPGLAEGGPGAPSLGPVLAEQLLLTPEGGAYWLAAGLPAFELDAWIDGLLAEPPLPILRTTPPERLQGGAEDRRSDLYAAALLTMELLIGRPVLDGSADELLDQIVEDRVMGLMEAAGAGLPDPALDLWCASVSADPSHRPRDAAELIHFATPLLRNAPGRPLVELIRALLPPPAPAARPAPPPGPRIRSAPPPEAPARRESEAPEWPAALPPLPAGASLADIRSHARSVADRTARLAAWAEHQARFSPPGLSGEVLLEAAQRAQGAARAAASTVVLLDLDDDEGGARLTLTLLEGSERQAEGAASEVQGHLDRAREAVAAQQRAAEQDAAARRRAEEATASLVSRAQSYQSWSSAWSERAPRTARRAELLSTLQGLLQRLQAAVQAASRGVQETSGTLAEAATQAAESVAQATFTSLDQLAEAWAQEDQRALAAARRGAEEAQELLEAARRQLESHLAEVAEAAPERARGLAAQLANLPTGRRDGVTEADFLTEARQRNERRKQVEAWSAQLAPTLQEVRQQRAQAQQAEAERRALVARRDTALAPLGGLEQELERLAVEAQRWGLSLAGVEAARSQLAALSQARDPRTLTADWVSRLPGQIEQVAAALPPLRQAVEAAQVAERQRRARAEAIAASSQAARASANHARDMVDRVLSRWKALRDEAYQLEVHDVARALQAAHEVIDIADFQAAEAANAAGQAAKQSDPREAKAYAETAASFAHRIAEDLPEAESHLAQVEASLEPMRQAVLDLGQAHQEAEQARSAALAALSQVQQALAKASGGPRVQSALAALARLPAPQDLPAPPRDLSPRDPASLPRLRALAAGADTARRQAEAGLRTLEDAKAWEAEQAAERARRLAAAQQTWSGVEEAQRSVSGRWGGLEAAARASRRASVQPLADALERLLIEAAASLRQGQSALASLDPMTIEARQVEAIAAARRGLDAAHARAEQLLGKLTAELQEEAREQEAEAKARALARRREAEELLAELAALPLPGPGVVPAALEPLLQTQVDLAGRARASAEAARAGDGEQASLALEQARVLAREARQGLAALQQRLAALEARRKKAAEDQARLLQERARLAAVVGEIEAGVDALRREAAQITADQPDLVERAGQALRTAEAALAKAAATGPLAAAATDPTALAPLLAAAEGSLSRVRASEATLRAALTEGEARREQERLAREAARKAARERAKAPAVDPRHRAVQVLTLAQDALSAGGLSSSLRSAIQAVAPMLQASLHDLDRVLAAVDTCSDEHLPRASHLVLSASRRLEATNGELDPLMAEVAAERERALAEQARRAAAEEAARLEAARRASRAASLNEQIGSAASGLQQAGAEAGQLAESVAAWLGVRQPSAGAVEALGILVGSVEALHQLVQQNEAEDQRRRAALSSADADTLQALLQRHLDRLNQGAQLLEQAALAEAACRAAEAEAEEAQARLKAEQEAQAREEEERRAAEQRAQAAAAEDPRQRFARLRSRAEPAPPEPPSASAPPADDARSRFARLRSSGASSAPPSDRESLRARLRGEAPPAGVPASGPTVTATGVPAAPLPGPPRGAGAADIEPPVSPPETPRAVPAWAPSAPASTERQIRRRPRPGADES